MTKASTSRRERRRHSQMNERTTIIAVDFGHDQVITGLKAPDENGQFPNGFEFYGERGEVVVPKQIKIGSAYKRASNKLKHLTSGPADPSAIQLEPNRHLKSFAHVFAVDTNTITVGSVVVSVTASLRATHIDIDGSGAWSAQIEPLPMIEFHDARVPPERLGWRAVLQMMATFHLTGRTALIVDSELGSHDALNRREAEIVPGVLLPDEVTLVYGSSDAGTVESVGNKMLAVCDREARAVFRRIRLGDEGSASPFRRGGSECASFRHWPKPKLTSEHG